MTIKRDTNLNPVKDFMLNVQPILSVYDVPEEIYQNGQLIGWEIKNLMKRQ
jgi:hypothetical protein